MRIRIIAILLIFMASLSFESTAQSRIKNLSKLYKKSISSVVLIKSEYFRYDENTQEIYNTYTIGAGFFVSSDGLVVSTDHLFNKIKVVEDFIDDVTVVRSVYTFDRATIFYNNKPYEADIVAISPELEFGILKLKNPDREIFPALLIGDSTEISIGDPVFLIGNPGGLEKVLKTGIAGQLLPIGVGGPNVESLYISGITLYTDMGVGKGDSGGPVFDKLGRAIGIANFSSNYLNLSGVSLITEQIKKAIEYAKNNTILQKTVFKCDFYTAYPLDISLLNQEMALKDISIYRTLLQIPPNLNNGVVLFKVKELGFMDKDVIVEFNNQPILNIPDFLKKVANTPVGKSIKFKLYRNGKVMEFYTILGTETLVWKINP